MRKIIPGENDFASLYPDAAKEWHPVLNGDKKPSDFLPGSGYKAWWKCSKCGHEWQAVILHRKDGVGCPLCARKSSKETYRLSLLKRKPPFSQEHPELLAEWDYEKNEISPNQITSGTKKKIYWKCLKGHPSFLDTINHRLNGRGCPVCSGHKILAGVNDLASHYPSLAKQWHPSLNGTLTPDKIGLTSNKKIWWLCPKGHSYQSLVQSRISGQGCPICSNHKILAGVNDLATLNPDLAKEWHPTKNGAVNPSMVGPGSHAKRWWKCLRCGHEWQASPKTRSSGCGCPKCASGKQTSFPEQALLFYLSKTTRALSRQKINGFEVDVFLPDYNLGIEYDGIRFHSTKASSVREAKKNRGLSSAGITLLRIKEINKGSSFLSKGCFFYRYSRNYQNISEIVDYVLSQIGVKRDFEIDFENDQVEINAAYLTYEAQNSLLFNKPELASEWDYEKNGGLSPDTIAVTSGKKVWWRCPKGHSYLMDAYHRFRGHGCPYCSGHRVMPGFNDLTKTDPEVAALWNYEKNSIRPEEVSRGSEKIVFWKCEHGHEWKAMVCSVVNSPKCPVCANRILLKGFNDFATRFPSLSKEWDYKGNGSLKPCDVMPSYPKKVWWVCPKGHHYEALISNRTKKNGTGCPVCAGKKVIQGENDLQHLRPEIAMEWHPTKNGSLLPTQVTSGSNKIVWWKCSHCGYEWSAPISRRTGANPKCPKCKKGK